MYSYEPKQQSGIIANNSEHYIANTMGEICVQIALPGVLQGEHSLVDVISVYSHDRTFFSQTFTSKFFFLEMNEVFRVYLVCKVLIGCFCILIDRRLQVYWPNNVNVAVSLNEADEFDSGAFLPFGAYTMSLNVFQSLFSCYTGSRQSVAQGGRTGTLQSLIVAPVFISARSRATFA